MVYEFVQNNFVPVITIIFLLVFIKTNVVFEKDITNRFLIDIVILVILSVTENIEYALSLRPTPTMARTIVAMIGYMLRPWIVYQLILVLGYKSRKERILLAIPGLINVLIECTALFSGVAFYYDAANKFTRGPLGFAPHVCSSFYLILILVLSARFLKERNYMEAGIVLAIVVICLLATVLESIWDMQGLLRGASALSITFFYLYFCAQSFKRDALTKALNRHCFYQDAEKYKDKLAAVLSVDLNNLKVINDTQGHAAGDDALCTTAECIRNNLFKGCFLYRTGGDEFMVLCPKNVVTIEQLREMMQRVYEDMKQTPYRCAIGIAEYRPGESFNALCARADEDMYEMKMEMKRQG